MLRLLNFRCSFCSNPLDETQLLRDAAEAVARVEAQANSEPNRTTGLPPDVLFMREKECLRPIVCFVKRI